MTEALIAGKVITLPTVGLFADGAAVKTVGQETFRVSLSLYMCSFCASFMLYAICTCASVFMEVMICTLYIAADA
jgi:threonine dehydratase